MNAKGASSAERLSISTYNNLTYVEVDVTGEMILEIYSDTHMYYYIWFVFILCERVEICMLSMDDDAQCVCVKLTIYLKSYM